MDQFSENRINSEYMFAYWDDRKDWVGGRDLNRATLKQTESQVHSRAYFGNTVTKDTHEGSGVDHKHQAITRFVYKCG